MNLPRRVRFKDFINYSDEKAIFVGLNFAIVSLFFQSLAQFKHNVYQLEFVGDEHVLVWPFSLMDATLKDFLILRPTGHLKSCHLRKLGNKRSANFKLIKSKEIGHFENLKRGVLKQHPRDELLR